MSNDKGKVFTIPPDLIVDKKESIRTCSKRKKLWNGLKKFKLANFHLNGDDIRVEYPEESANADKSRLIDGIYGPVALVICISASFTVTLLPAQNVITNPEYWYEIFFSTSSFFFFLATATVIEAEIALNPFNKSISLKCMHFTKMINISILNRLTNFDFLKLHLKSSLSFILRFIIYHYNL